MNQLAEPMAPGTEPGPASLVCGISGKDIPRDEALQVGVWVTIRSENHSREHNVNIPVSPEYFDLLKGFLDDPLLWLKGLAVARALTSAEPTDGAPPPDGAPDQEAGSGGLAPNAGGAPEAEQPPPPNGAPEAEQDPSAAPPA